jgi:hypothetical protein
VPQNSLSELIGGAESSGRKVAQSQAAGHQSALAQTDPACLAKQLSAAVADSECESRAGPECSIDDRRDGSSSGSDTSDADDFGFTNLSLSERLQLRQSASTSE